MPIYLKIILTVGFFILGALLGSLIDLIIFRVSRKEPIFKGKFHCDFCGRSLTFAECLPLIGRFAGKGKCRECGKKIPLNSVKACVPYRIIAPIKQAKNKQISTRFVAIAPITTNKISNTLIKPSDIISSPSIFYNE